MLFVALSKLLLSDSKSKESIVDSRKKGAKTHTTAYISGAEVKKMKMVLGHFRSNRKHPDWKHHKLVHDSSWLKTGGLYSG